jgi:hypothetical protein
VIKTEQFGAAVIDEQPPSHFVLDNAPQLTDKDGA